MVERKTPSDTIAAFMEKRAAELTDGQRRAIESIHQLCQRYEFEHPGSNSLPRGASKRLYGLVIGQGLQDQVLVELLKSPSHISHLRGGSEATPRV